MTGTIVLASVFCLTAGAGVTWRFLQAQQTGGGTVPWSPLDALRGGDDGAE